MPDVRSLLQPNNERSAGRRVGRRLKVNLPTDTHELLWLTRSKVDRPLAALVTLAIRDYQDNPSTYLPMPEKFPRQACLIEVRIAGSLVDYCRDEAYRLRTWRWRFVGYLVTRFLKTHPLNYLQRELYGYEDIIETVLELSQHA